MNKGSTDPGVADLQVGEPSAAGTGRNWISVASWIFVALGAVLQTAHFAGARALWLDEAMLALNLRHLSAAELLGPLDYDQAAPLGWLQLEKLLFGLPAPPEYSLRLPSLLAGLGSLVLFRHVAFRLLGGLGALAATAIFALSPAMVRYAAEVKPYALDVFFGLVILALGLAILARRDIWRPGLVALAAAGLVGILFSFSVVFVLAGVGAVLFVHRVTEGRRAEAALLVAVGLGWVALFAGLMLRIYNPQVAGTGLRSGIIDTFYHYRAYVPFPPTSLADLVWYAQWLQSLVQFMFTKEGRFPMAVAIVGGLVLLSARTPWRLALICAPLLAGVVASVVEAYPLYDRLALFMLPGLVLLAGASVGWLSLKARSQRLTWAVLTFLCAAGGLAELAGNLRRSPPYDIQNVRPAFETLRREAGPDDLVYVSFQAIPVYLFYREAYGLSKLAWVPGKEYRQAWTCMLPAIPDLGSPRRVWFLVLFVSQTEPPEAEAVSPVLASRNLQGRLDLASAAQNVWLYSLRAGPRPGEAAARSDPPPAACGRPPGATFAPPRRFLERTRQRPPTPAA